MTSILTLKVAMVLFAGAATGTANTTPPVNSPAAATAPVAAPPTAPVATISIAVTNPMVKPRLKETISLSIPEIVRKVPAFDAKKSIVTDAAGKTILSQLADMDGDESPDEIVFQADIGARETKTFKLKTGQRPLVTREEYQAFGRFVRERHDDFAWENDRVAHRMYGPDLETCKKEPLTSSGIDTWVKRVSKLVINDWYMTDNYHQDHGEGADFYAVGKSRGCGGLGIWAGKQLYVSKNFTHSRVLANGPIRVVFELSYAPWEAGKNQIVETKRVTLDAGTQFNRFESTFTGQKGSLAVGLGIAKHPESTVKVDAKRSTLRTWEPLDKGKSGNLGCAIVLPSGSRLEEHHDDLNYMVVTPARADGRLIYYAGSVWDKAGLVIDAASWAAEVQHLADRIAAPVKMVISVDR
jgi:hypothetical protein